MSIKISLMKSKAEIYYRNLVNAMVQTNELARYNLLIDEELLRKQLYPAVQRVVLSHVKGQVLSDKQIEEIIEYNLAQSVKETIDSRKSGRSNTLKELEAKIQNTIVSRGIKLDGVPYLAQLPTGKFTARILKVPRSNEYLVLFDRHLFTFALLVSKIIALSIPCKIDESNGSLSFSLDRNVIGSHIYNNPEPIKRLYELIVAHLFDGGINNAPQYSISPAEYKIAEIIWHCMELFVLAHEYAHWLNGDLDNPIKGARSVEDLEEVGLWFGWDREFMADKLGIELAIDSIQGAYFDKSWVYASACAFFEILHLFDKASSIFAKNEYDTTDKRMIMNTVSHPPPRMRIGSFRTRLEKEDVDNEISMTILAIIEALWEQVESKLIAAKSELEK